MGEYGKVIRQYDSGGKGEDIIKLNYKRNYYNVRSESIEYIRAYSGESEFKVNEHFLRKKISLNDMEECLNEDIFFRVNKSYIVNLLWITDYREGIVSIGDMEIPVSKRRKKKFEKSYMEYKLRDCVVV